MENLVHMNDICSESKGKNKSVQISWMIGVLYTHKNLSVHHILIGAVHVDFLCIMLPKYWGGIKYHVRKFSQYLKLLAKINSHVKLYGQVRTFYGNIFLKVYKIILFKSFPLAYLKTFSLYKSACFSFHAQISINTQVI